MSVPRIPRILDKLVPTKLFARLTIARKMLLGYMTLVVLTVIVVAYALVSLQRINSLNRSIVKVDVMVEEASDKMLDALLAQDTYEKRFLILKSADMKNLFAKRGKEFRNWLNVLKNLPDRDSLPIGTIDSLYTRYTDLFMKETQLVGNHDVEQAWFTENFPHEPDGVCTHELGIVGPRCKRLVLRLRRGAENGLRLAVDDADVEHRQGIAVGGFHGRLQWLAGPDRRRCHLTQLLRIVRVDGDVLEAGLEGRLQRELHLVRDHVIGFP